MDIREIAVDTNTLQNDIRDMQDALGKVKEKSERMFDGLDALGSMWEGDSHDAFIRQERADRQKMQELWEVIARLIECMQYADKEYISCENTVHSIIKTIQI